VGVDCWVKGKLGGHVIPFVDFADNIHAAASPYRRVKDDARCSLCHARYRDG
jgi:hypothetical protein